MINLFEGGKKEEEKSSTRDKSSHYRRHAQH